MRARLLLVLSLATALLAGCGRVKSCARSVLRGDDGEPKPLPVNQGPATPTPINAHPRIWLDAETIGMLRKRMSAGTATWKALDAKVTSRMEGPVEWPDGKDYPSPGVGEGYQGSEYWEAVLDLALVSVVLKEADPARSKALAARAAEVLDKMSETSGPHAVEPLRDDGFGIRFFVTAMAIGYDWLHAELSPELLEKLRAAMTRWIETYDAKGFARDHPQGNYFAGYYAAKALAALATQDDFDKSPTWWNDWHERMHKRMVQPYYAKHLAGGGWPEGWTYGSFGTLNMTWPALAALTAKNVDLFRDASAPYTFPFDQGLHIVHFAWPDRVHVDDRGTHYEGLASEVGTAPAWTLTVLPALLRKYDDALAPMLQKYARQTRERRSKDAKPVAWMEFLYWDDAAPEKDYESLPRSFVAWGMGAIATRSSWAEDAVWASFTSGPHVANAEAGHMQFDQGSLAVVRGDLPVLVNAATAVRRRQPGEPPAKGEDPVYEELFGNHDKDPAKGNRTLFNIFYARVRPPDGKPEPLERYGQIAAMPPKPKTRLARFEDKDLWVLARGEDLDDMYRKGKKNEVRVAGWTRQVLYVRPSVFVIDDRTEVGDADLDQWMAFHLPAPLAPRASEPGVFDAGAGERFAGTLAAVLPKDAGTKTVDVYDRKRVVRVEVRPPRGKTQRWLTVLDAAPPGPGATKVRVLDGAHGAVIETASGPIVASFGPSKYKAPLGGTHYVADLEPRTEVTITATRNGSEVAIAVERGAGMRASDGGVIAFRVEEDGRIVPAAPAPR